MRISLVKKKKIALKISNAIVFNIELRDAKHIGIIMIDFAEKAQFFKSEFWGIDVKHACMWSNREQFHR